MQENWSIDTHLRHEITRFVLCGSFPWKFWHAFRCDRPQFSDLPTMCDRSVADRRKLKNLSSSWCSPHMCGFTHSSTEIFPTSSLHTPKTTCTNTAFSAPCLTIAAAFLVSWLLWPRRSERSCVFKWNENRFVLVWPRFQFQCSVGFSLPKKPLKLSHTTTCGWISSILLYGETETLYPHEEWSLCVKYNQMYDCLNKTRRHTVVWVSEITNTKTYKRKWWPLCVIMTKSLSLLSDKRFALVQRTKIANPVIWRVRNDRL